MPVSWLRPLGEVEKQQRHLKSLSFFAPRTLHDHTATPMCRSRRAALLGKCISTPTSIHSGKTSPSKTSRLSGSGGNLVENHSLLGCVGLQLRTENTRNISFGRRHDFVKNRPQTSTAPRLSTPCAFRHHWMTHDAHVSPPPNTTSKIKSPRWNRPSRAASSSAIATDAAETLP